MSEFSVHRTADRIPALRYCLVLDGTRIAGGKPDYRGDNHLISWQTDETYGPVNDLMSENAKLRDEMDAAKHDLSLFSEGIVELGAENTKLRELVADAWGYINHPADATWTHKKRKEVRDSLADRMRELGVEVD